MSTKTLLIFSLGAAILIVLIIAAGFISRGEDCRDFKQARLNIDGVTYNVALAQTQIEQTRGLSGCQKIPNRSGMYFVYNHPSVVSFWMKKMVIPIDIIWITDGKVIGVAPNLPPQETLAVDPPTYNPPRAVTGVL
ncbi:MAG: DUF192 domain-containing protein, partial [Candidatus Andersenbacteria bacterium]|nr:DUF192 domain-containing protein [Candidatus Andersenbacteria bacterium]